MIFLRKCDDNLRISAAKSIGLRSRPRYFELKIKVDIWNLKNSAYSAFFLFVKIRSQ